MKEVITGIQQVGIGVSDANEAKHIYKDLFGMNVLIFDDKSPATLMMQYTGNKIHNRHAILSMNLSGGGGFEIWQFTSAKPRLQPFPNFGDIGIFSVKIKSQNVQAAHQHFSRKNNIIVSGLMKSYDDRSHFWLTDNYGNNFNIIEGDEWFHSNNHVCGGVAGAVIGVTDMDKAVEFYKNVLGINELIYDSADYVADIPEPKYKNVRRVLLKKQQSCIGAFGKLLGAVQVELVQVLHHPQKKLFQDRFWGDCGFIHLCFDVLNMDELKNKFESKGFIFSVDSKDSYSMETSEGRFCYVEDPDGTLIELVETHKVPILKKFGWHLDLRKRKNDGPLPDWMIKILGFNKIK
jgi:catechol 2,3-dioxygenase-like lactoylglutathione lyase family enzyme